MITINDSEFEEMRSFADTAAEYFAENPRYAVYTENGPIAGELFAVRWGSDDHRVVVFRLSDHHPIFNFGDYSTGGRLPDGERYTGLVAEVPRGTD